MTAPSAPPLLALLNRLLGDALAEQAAAAAPDAAPHTGKRVRVQRTVLDDAGALLTLRLRAGGLIDTTLDVRVTIEAVGAESTRCRLSLPPQGGVARLLGASLQHLPRGLLAGAVERLAGDAASLEGDVLQVHHTALLRRLGVGTARRPEPGDIA